MPGSNPSSAPPVDPVLTTAALRKFACVTPDKPAFIFLGDGQRESARVSYAELRTRAIGVAHALEAARVSGHPVLLAYPPGLDFVVALMGCFLAGAIATPVAWGRDNGNLARVGRSARPMAILGLAGRQYDRSGVPCIDTDTISTEARTWQAEPAASAIALIQYTSGSTGEPNGTIITHANIAHNAAAMARAFELTAEDIGVSWLPTHHDMGLIGWVLTTIHIGATCVLLPPLRVAQHPLYWLEAITRYRGTVSAAPTFGYAICNQRVPDEALTRLDLASWRVAACGAEPVRADILDRFAARFAASGFDAGAINPVYGLAEATLMIAAYRRPGASFATMTLDPLALANGRVVLAASGRSVVSCGPARDCEIAIVGPDRQIASAPGQVGEIWVSGASVGQGYWGLPDRSRDIFEAVLPGRSCRWLRTGDLGFIHDDELYITGRLKELIVIRGRNIHPQDVEDAVRASHSALAQGRCVAFGVELSGGEALVVAFEPERSMAHSFDEASALRAASAAVFAAFGLKLHDFVVLRPGGLPRTTSGKPRRGQCRELYLAGMLRSRTEPVP